MIIRKRLNSRERSFHLPPINLFSFDYLQNQGTKPKVKFTWNCRESEHELNNFPSNHFPTSVGDEAMMCIDHIDAARAHNAEANASFRQGMHRSARCSHKSRQKCSSVEKSGLELILTCSVSWRETHETGRGELKLSFIPL